MSPGNHLLVITGENFNNLLLGTQDFIMDVALFNNLQKHLYSKLGLLIPTKTSLIQCLKQFRDKVKLLQYQLFHLPHTKL